MANVWGPRANGEDGVMTRDEIVAHLYTVSELVNDGRKGPNTKAFEKAADFMMGHDHKGGGTKYLFENKVVFHTSENHGEATVFFAYYGDGDIEILRVGKHSGKKNEKATYTFARNKEWAPKWRPKMKVDGILCEVKQISL
jgi:hypothetical protein